MVGIPEGTFPHFDGEGLTQHVCFPLFDSIPQLLRQWREELAAVQAGKTSDKNRELRKRIHEFLDSGHGSCFLRDERLGKVVDSALLHFESAAI